MCANLIIKKKNIDHNIHDNVHVLQYFEVLRLRNLLSKVHTRILKKDIISTIRAQIKQV
jgi:hypothetical protein